MRSVLVVALLVVAGCGVPLPAPAVPPLDPFALVGWWDDGSGGLVVIDPDRIEVRTAAGTSGGDWRGDSGGRFLAAFSSFAPGPGRPAEPFAEPAVAGATSFVVLGPQRELRGPGGVLLARLSPGRPLPHRYDTAVDPSRAPTAEQRGGAQPPDPLPSGLRSGDPVGRWSPEGWSGPTRPGVEFRADGTWGANDGCNAVGGRWVGGPDGGLLVVAGGASTLIGCTGLDVPGQVLRASRTAFDGPVLVLLDASGVPTGRLVQA